MTTTVDVPSESPRERMTVWSRNLPLTRRGAEGPERVESVSSRMQEALVHLLNATTVSNPPDGRHRIRTASMSAMADDLS